MARKSKYGQPSGKPSTRLWKPALYVRLSREDGDREESDSIANQRDMLAEFAAAQDDLAAPAFYTDDGFTGTDFDRPGFRRMMDDLRAGTVNCVIVKDLSRFGRNYVGVGEYLEQVFPLLDVRFISVNDRVDSFLDPRSVNNLVVPFKNIINDEYCRDISNKVRASLDLKRRQGKFIGSFASYGYRKDPADHSRLLVDGQAAAVVRDIFDWFVGGMSVLGIAKRLNEMGVPNPSVYKRRQGMNYRHPASDKLDGLWPDSSVRRILRNRLYTGTMVQGKNRIKSYKLHVSEAVPEADWIEVAATHEAIIPAELFERAQALFTRDTRTAPAQKEVYLFSGFLRCADCGRAMHRKTISQPYGDYHYYICSTFKKQHSGACTKHTIRSDRLEQAVLEALRHQIALAVEMDELVAEINRSSTRGHNAKRLLDERAQLEAERERIEQMKLSLYPDWKAGDISREEYHQLKAQFEQRQAGLDGRIAAVQARIDEVQNGVDETNSFLTQFVQYRSLQKLTREAVVELIDMIYVHEGGGITIQFKFSDAYAAAKEYIQDHGQIA
ncbi:MAG TPA: recombinase family protein [Candidatus Agathobaculum stercoravium]|nr:recombinase family protein [Candidatus Agathobaculum stercoravium]